METLIALGAIGASALIWLVRLEGKVKINAVVAKGVEERLGLLLDFKEQRDTGLLKDIEEIRCELKEINGKISELNLNLAKVGFSPHGRLSDAGR